MNTEPTGGAEFATVTFRDPGDIIAAVPAMLGFVPERSLILITFVDAGARVGVTMRHDVDLDPDGGISELMCAVVEQLCEVCLRERVSAVFAIVVDDRAEVVDPRWEALFDLIDVDLDDVGLSAGFVTTTIAAGARWTTAWGHPDRHGSGGTLADPRSTPMAVAQAVTSGRVVLTSRASMTVAVEPGAHCAETGCAATRSVHATAGARRTGRADDAARLRLVLDSVVDGLDPQPSCSLIVALDEAIRRPLVRDALLSVASSDLEDNGTRLWADLTRRLRGPGRAAAAALLAHAHYLAGDGAMAGVALDAALAAQPGHSFAQLLDRSLRAGMRPDVIAELLPTSRAVARSLGVTVPSARRRLDRGA